MLLSVLSSLAILSALVLGPLGPNEQQAEPSSDIRPIVLVTQRQAEPGGFELAQVARQIVDGATARLRDKGVTVDVAADGNVKVAARAAGEMWGDTPWDVPSRFAGSGKAISLSVGFNTGSSRWASGSETRFGGNGDAAWRLAARIQRHLVRGLSDVLAYDSYDRGLVEDRGVLGDLPSESIETAAGAPWVSFRPLFATNERERAMLERPDVADLISAALANAILDYLDPSQLTPARDPGLGWRLSQPWQPVAPKAIYGAEASPRVALTFDGGASSAPTPAILDALREAGVRATMFMTADFVQRNPELVVRMARDGHEFGNHSATHPDMTKLSAQGVVEELDRVETLVRALTGKSTHPWFRPPYGASDERLVRRAAEQGYYTVLWTADSADWREEIAASTVRNRLLNYASPGAILIEHLGSPQSAQVLAGVLRTLKDRGINFGTLSEVLGNP